MVDIIQQRYVTIFEYIRRGWLTANINIRLTSLEHRITM